MILQSFYLYDTGIKWGCVKIFITITEKIAYNSNCNFIDRELAQLGRARRSGRRGRKFESCIPDFLFEGDCMLTPREVQNTRQELQENFRRLGYDLDRVSQETELSKAAIQAVLIMDHPQPGDVWQVRDYLEDMLVQSGQAVYPWSKLANHSANRWFAYRTPWREK